jgi:hypothetical protein
MPIKREWRKLYTGPEWQAAKARTLKRYENRCCNCGKPKGAVVWTYTWKTRDLRFGGGYRYHMVWLLEATKVWRDRLGHPLPKSQWPAPGLPRRIKVQIGVAHKDHDPANRDDSNLRAWCNWCHLHHDSPHHQETRQKRRDRERPMLAEAS